MSEMSHFFVNQIWRHKKTGRVAIVTELPNDLIVVVWYPKSRRHRTILRWRFVEIYEGLFSQTEDK